MVDADQRAANEFERLAADVREREARIATSEGDFDRREQRLDRRQDALDERERELDERLDTLDIREGQVKDREADVARITARADRVEAELDAQREGLRDAEEAVGRERQVLQRRMAEIEEKQDRLRREQDRAVEELAAPDGSGKGRGLLRGGGGSKAAEALHAQLRDKEIGLEEQERKLHELQTALQRREADLNTYARKLQQSVATGPSERPAVDEQDEERQDADPTAKRLQFWSR
jgi:chromosome segregation ATPase